MAKKIKDADKIINPADPWRDDSIQFARLLAEINAIGLNKAQIAELQESMDIVCKADLEELFDRAENRWAEVKKTTGGKVLAVRPKLPGWRLDKDGWYVRKINNSEWSAGLSFYKKDRQGEGFVTSSLRVYARTPEGCLAFDKFVKG